MYVEQELVLLIGIALVESSRDSTVRGTDVAVHDVAEDSVHVRDLSELLG